MSEKQQALKPISEETARKLLAAIDEITNETVSRSMKYKDEIEQHGEKAFELLKNGMYFTFKMLFAAMQTGETGLLDDQAEWALSRLPHDNVRPVNIIKRLERMKTVVAEKMSREHTQEISPYIDYLIQKMSRISDP